MLISDIKKDLYANNTKNKHVCFLLKYKEKKNPLQIKEGKLYFTF